MRVLSMFTLLAFFAVILSSCSPEHSKILVASFDNENITLGEFEKAFVKNVGNLEKAKQQTPEEYKEFADLYVNFRMKLKDADERNYAVDPSIKSELEDYQDKIGSSFVLEKYLYDPGIEQLYERRKEEVRISHIMIRTDTIKTAEASQKANEILNKIKNGESFEKMAKEYSSDPYSKDSGGDIYYITSGQLPVEMEDAAYNTPVGSVYPEVVTTQFGAHLIKVTDRQPRRYKINARHILVKFTDAEGKPDTAEAFEKAKSIRDSIMAGANFQEMAQRHSDDKGSAVKGGELGFFERRSMVKQFDSTAFSLKVGEVSGIVETRFGYHIIQVIDEETFPPLDQIKTELREVYQKTRFDKEHDSFIGKLKGEFNFKINDNTIKNIASENDSCAFGDDYWTCSLHKLFGDTAVCYIGKNPITFDTLMANTIKRSGYYNRNINEELILKGLKEYTNELLIKEKAKALPSSDERFKDLMSDYKNGIYIFKLQEDQVWSKIEIDSLKLFELYQSTKDQYNWPDRVDFSEIFANKDSLTHVYFAMVENGGNFDSIAANYTQRPKYKSQAGRWGITEVSSNESAKQAFALTNPGDISEIFKSGNGFAFVRLNQKLPAGPKTFDEAKAEVASLYQEKESKRLEEAYIESLRAKYNPKINYDEVEKAFKENSK